MCLGLGTVFYILLHSARYGKARHTSGELGKFTGCVILTVLENIALYRGPLRESTFVVISIGR